MTIEDTPENSPTGGLPGQLAELQRFYGPLPLPPSDAFALFAWEVLSKKASPAGRDAAMSALRRVHVLTPDAVTRAARATLEAAVAPAGPSVELRLDALRAGAEVFRRHRALPGAIRGSLAAARRSLRGTDSTRCGRRASDAALRRRPCGRAGRCRRAARGAAARIRPAGEGSIGSRCSASARLAPPRRPRRLPPRLRLPVAPRVAHLHRARTALPGLSARPRMSVGAGNPSAK